MAASNSRAVEGSAPLSALGGQGRAMEPGLMTRVRARVRGSIPWRRTWDGSSSAASSRPRARAHHGSMLSGPPNPDAGVTPARLTRARSSTAKSAGPARAGGSRFESWRAHQSTDLPVRCSWDTPVVPRAAAGGRGWPLSQHTAKARLDPRHGHWETAGLPPRACSSVGRAPSRLRPSGGSQVRVLACPLRGGDRGRPPAATSPRTNPTRKERTWN